MADTLAQRGPPRRLSEVLVRQPDWAAAERLQLFRRLVLLVKELHDGGQTHRAIHADSVTVDGRFVPQLDAPAPWQDLGGDSWDPQRSPPELAKTAGLRLPRQIEAATGVLRDRGLAIDPRQVDVYQLGTLLCQLLTGRTVLAYMYTATVKSGIPAPVRPFLERMLGEGNWERFQDCGQVLAELDAVAGRLAGQPLRSPTRETPAAGGAISSSQDTPPAGGTSVPESPRADDLPFRRLGQYRIVARIGRGGMGDVYRAVDESLHRDVALKVLPAELTRDPEFVRRFRAEATAVAQIAHPNIVPIYTIGEDAGHHYFAMQLVEGQPLAERLVRSGRLPLGETLEIVRQCLAGLGAAHQRGLIHRDVKPGNVLLDARTRLAMLVDFGLVRAVGAGTQVTATGIILGTPDYIAPEQSRGEPVDGRTDLYSLGVLAYELLAGRLPFEADSAMAMIYQHAHAKPYPLWKAAPDVPRAVADIIGRMMAKRPQDRYPSAGEALADIRAFEAGEPVSAAAAATPQSLVAQAAELGIAPELPPSTARWLKPRWWQSIEDRAMSLVRRHAPRVVEELQTTEQLVDGAVVQYERRHEKLARLVAEAEEILAELAERKQSYLGAVQRAEQRIATAVGEPQQEQARRNLAHCRRATADVDEQHGRLEEELADLRLRKAQAHARLLELVNQRDLLEARLNAARARAGLAGRRARPRRVPRWMMAGFALVMVAAAVRAFVWWTSPPRNRAPSPSLETPVAANQPADSQPVTAPAPRPATAGGREDIDPALISNTWKGALPAQVLEFRGTSAEFQLSGIDRRWLSKALMAKLLVKLDPNAQRQWVVGNLDTRGTTQGQAGWALLLLPAVLPKDEPDTVTVKWRNFDDPYFFAWPGWSRRPFNVDLKRLRRLAFAYATTGGTVRRIVGPPFYLGDYWRKIEVWLTPEQNEVMILLGGRPYLKEPTEAMLLEPGPTRLWLGAPWFAEGGFTGQVASFELDVADSAGRQSRATSKIVSLDFSIPRDDMVFDTSGWGNHGRFSGRSGAGGPTWLVSPARLPAAYKEWSAPAGQAFVVACGEYRSVELLRTEGMFGLDDEFTVEMWFQKPVPGGQDILLNSAAEADPAATGYRHAGWSLVLSYRFPDLRRLSLRYPADSQSVGTLASKDFPWDEEWHHLALCNTPSRRQLYVDGQPLLANEEEQADAIRENWIPSPLNLALGKCGQCATDRSRRAGTLIRAFRLSSGRRYDKAFTPPATFSRDAETLILLDVAHRTGPLIGDISGNHHDGLMVGSQWTTEEKTW